MIEDSIHIVQENMTTLKNDSTEALKSLYIDDEMTNGLPCNITIQLGGDFAVFDDKIGLDNSVMVFVERTDKEKFSSKKSVCIFRVLLASLLIIASIFGLSWVLVARGKTSDIHAPLTELTTAQSTPPLNEPISATQPTTAAPQKTSPSPSTNKYASENQATQTPPRMEPTKIHKITRNPTLNVQTRTPTKIKLYVTENPKEIAPVSTTVITSAPKTATPFMKSPITKNVFTISPTENKTSLEPNFSEPVTHPPLTRAAFTRPTTSKVYYTRRPTTKSPLFRHQNQKMSLRDYQQSKHH